MSKLFQKKLVIRLFLMACFLLLSSCVWITHKPGKPGTMNMDKVFARHKTLAHQSLYLTFVDSKGIFSKRTFEDYVYEFSDDNTFKYYQTAEHVLVASGKYKYIISAKKDRLAFIKFYNQTGVFGQSTVIMQLNFYNPDMGICNMALSRSPKTNYATGIFILQPISFH